jgi:hypothetical protein
MPALQQEAARPRLVLPKLLKNTLCKKKIPCHIKLAIPAWINKYR